MITAVDTSVLLDVFTADPRFGAPSKQALRRCSNEGRLVACEAVMAEIASAFGAADDALVALETVGIEFEPMSLSAALEAGSRFRVYRERGGQRDRVIADFLIGAHALERADRLLSRDRGFQRTYFAGLEVLDPSLG